MDKLFAETWVLITGASSGLGEQFARQLAARRANLILTARSGDKLEALASELRRAHAIATEVVVLDLSVPGGAEQLCTEVDRRGHFVSHLISNAGVGLAGSFVTNSQGDQTARYANLVRLNCEALTVLSYHFVPKMVERRQGGVLHLASLAGFQPVPFMAVYGATKAYVLSFSAALGEELRGTGVRCLALCPGPVPTGFQAVAGAGIAASQKHAVLTAEQTVRRGLRAYERGKDVFIPGAFNQLSILSSKVLPRRLLAYTVGKMMKTKGSLTSSLQ